MVYRQTEAVLARLEDKRNAILEAAAEIATTEGLDFKINAVAARADVAVGTIYKHWPNQAELAAAIIVRRLDADFTAMSSASRAAGGRPLNGFAALLAVYIHRVRDADKLAPTLVAAPAYRVPMTRVFEDWITATGTADARLLARAIYGALNAVLLAEAPNTPARKNEPALIAMALRVIGVDFECSQALATEASDTAVHVAA